MGSDRTPGRICQATNPVCVQDGTSATAPSPTPGPTQGPKRGPDDVSYEIGACFVPVQTTLIGLDDAEMQVLAWLRANRDDIVKGEQTFRVDRRAIAGAIAWEMLENNKNTRRATLPIWMVRSAGPGKVHLFNFSLLVLPTFDTIATQTEGRGYLPKQGFADRKALLATSSGAIKYIAAIMSAISDIADQYKFYDVRSNPVILTNVYQSKTLKTWEEHLKSKPPGSVLAGGNTMDIWVSTHIAFLEDGVGEPNIPGSFSDFLRDTPTP
jgi:hypothetical protein